MINVPLPLSSEWKTWGRQMSTALQRLFNYVGMENLQWNEVEDTLNIIHADGSVSQQVGFETYMRVRNVTGSTIPNGTCVSFAGVGDEIQIAPFIANGTVDNLYFVGVTTKDMADGEIAPVTTYGKVRGLDTSAYTAGQILYASPTVAGGLTVTRPTAPDEVVVVAAVLVADAANGEIMVRPTIPMGLDYGSFSDTTAQTIAAINTPYPVQFNTTDISQGVTVESNGSAPTRITTADAGLYMISVSNQYTSTNSSAQNIQTWLRKNGTDVANSNSYTTIAQNNATTIFATTYLMSMHAGDYLEIMWSSDSTNVSLNSIAATGYSPAAPSTIVTVTQIQL